MTQLSVFLFWITALFSSFYVNAESINCQHHQCVAVVDAGSSGARLHIYAYEKDKTNSPTNITELWSKKITPGLASMEATKPKVNAYLDRLFSLIPEKKIPVYFYATAGMRLLPQNKQEQFYALLQDWFKNKTQWQLISAKTITGAEEGLFAWLTMNYQLGNFSANEETTLGVMDMGGASVQIIFPIRETADINSNDLYHLDLYGRHFTLFIHSFLGLGQTEVAHQFLDVASCFANNYQLPTGRPALGNAYFCKGEIVELMNKVHHVNDIVQNAIQINPVNSWYVMGGVVPLAQSQLFHFPSQQFTNNSLLTQADIQICQQPWPILNGQYPEDEYLYGYCLFSSYYYALMVEGYGINPQQTIHYISSSAGDWTLGVILQQKLFA